MPTDRDALRDLLPRVDADAGVLGAILTGSRAREGTSTPDSDTDVLLVVDGAARGRWSGIRSRELDIGIYTLDELSHPGLPATDPESWWNRYAFAHTVVLRDRLDGEIARLAKAQATYTGVEAAAICSEFLDGYLNFAIRSLKSDRDGRGFESRLDAGESIAWALVTVYALEERVRPYNKYLAWELRRHPLRNPEFAGDTLPALIDAIRGSGDTEAQRDLFRRIDSAARAAGHSSVIDGWGDDLTIFA